MAYILLKKNSKNETVVIAGSKTKETLCDELYKEMTSLNSSITVVNEEVSAAARYIFFNNVQKMCYYKVKDINGEEYTLSIEEISWV